MPKSYRICARGFVKAAATAEEHASRLSFGQEEGGHGHLIVDPAAYGGRRRGRDLVVGLVFAWLSVPHTLRQQQQFLPVGTGGWWRWWCRPWPSVAFSERPLSRGMKIGPLETRPWRHIRTEEAWSFPLCWGRSLAASCRCIADRIQSGHVEADIWCEEDEWPS